MPNQSLYRQEALDNLSTPEQYDRLVRVTTLPAWILLAASGSLIAAVIIWGVLGSLRHTLEKEGVLIFASATSTDTDKEVIILVTEEEIQDIQEGLNAQILPSTLTPDKYGYMTGKIISISPYPVTDTDIQALDINTEQLTDWLQSTTSLYLVKIALDMDSEGNPRWTAADSPDFTIAHGIPCSVILIIDEDKPINRIFPLFN